MRPARLAARAVALLGPLAGPVLVTCPWAPRLAAALALRLPPARARYPAARELGALGLAVERLWLDGGERVQLVRARRR